MSSFKIGNPQGQFLEAGIERCQYRHQNTATVGTRLTFAGSASFANFCFVPDMAFTAVIGRFHFRMRDKDE